MSTTTALQGDTEVHPLPPTQALKFQAPAIRTRTDEQEHHAALGVGAVLYIFINISLSPLSSSSCNSLHFCLQETPFFPTSELSFV